MELIPFSIFAGILTILSPCAFTLLPLILGGTSQSTNLKKALTVITSVCASIILFTLLLKSTTLLIDVPLEVWRIISGGILLVFGLITLFPDIWGRFAFKSGFNYKSEEALQKASSKNSFIGDILVGVSLGPVFTSCSPTFSLIIATVLPQSFGVGVINLVAYAIGLGLSLLIIAILGQRIIQKLKWAINPEGKFKKVLGIIFIILGILIITGIDKQIETALLRNEFFLKVTEFEIDLTKEIRNR